MAAVGIFFNAPYKTIGVKSGGIGSVDSISAPLFGSTGKHMLASS